MDPTATHALLEAAHEGDREAFDSLAAAAFPAVFDFVSGVEPDSAAAARLTAASLTHLAETLGAVTPANFRASTFRATWYILEREGYFAVTDEDDEPPIGTSAAVAALGAKRAALLDLHLRQGLTADELATVLGVSRGSARLLVRRLLLSAETELPPGPGSSALQAFTAVPLVEAPGGLRAIALAAVADGWPGARPLPVRRPTPAEEPYPARPSRWLVPVAAGLFLVAVALGASLLVPTSPIALTRKSDLPAAGAPFFTSPDPQTVVLVTATPRRLSPTPTRTPAATASSSPGAGSSATQTATPPASPTAGATQSATSTATRTPAPPTSTPAPPTPTPTAAPPTPTPTTCVVTIAAQVERLPATPGVDTFFPVYNFSACGPAGFTVTSDVPWLTIAPVLGSIPLNKSVDIHVVADPPAGSGTYSARLTVTGPANTLTVTVVSTRP